MCGLDSPSLSKHSAKQCIILQFWRHAMGTCEFAANAEKYNTVLTACECRQLPQAVAVSTSAATFLSNGKRLQCIAVQCSAVRCSAVQCSAVQCSAVRYGTVRYGTVQYGTVQCSAVHQGIIMYWCKPHVKQRHYRGNLKKGKGSLPHSIRGSGPELIAVSRQSTHRWLEQRCQTRQNSWGCGRGQALETEVAAKAFRVRPRPNLKGPIVEILAVKTLRNRYCHQQECKHAFWKVAVRTAMRILSLQHIPKAKDTRFQN